MVKMIGSLALSAVFTLLAAYFFFLPPNLPPAYVYIIVFIIFFGVIFTAVNALSGKGKKEDAAKTKES
ncbi:MAG: hypothetical protein AB1461_11660 [Thermodesulfobacteriota bacterium]